jgi:hypothetical protein
MNTLPTTTEHGKKPSSSDESRPGFRTKTISMRLTPDEAVELESAAERAGKQPSEWLRETALAAARERPSDPIELLLAEVWAVHHTLLSLFHAGAQATAEGKPSLPESVHKIRDSADRKKLEQARRMLADFLGQRSERGRRRAMNLRRILLIVARLLAFAAIAQAVKTWIFCRSSWTPIERHYLSAYFWSSIPVTGQVTRVMDFASTADRRVKLTYAFAPYEAFFVVFRDPAPAVHPVALSRGGEVIPLSSDTMVDEKRSGLVLRTAIPSTCTVRLSDGRESQVTVNPATVTETIGNWTLGFPPNWGGPAKVNVPELKSWTDFNDSGMRYFSGTATYRTTLHIDAKQLIPRHEPWLNLGPVYEVARIRVNGTWLTTLWKQPHSARIAATSIRATTLLRPT